MDNLSYEMFERSNDKCLKVIVKLFNFLLEEMLDLSLLEKHKREYVPTASPLVLPMLFIHQTILLGQGALRNSLNPRF